jgi:hypothetical protein
MFSGIFSLSTITSQGFRGGITQEAICDDHLALVRSNGIWVLQSIASSSRGNPMLALVVIQQ